MYPSGGLVTAIALRAMVAELARPDQQVRSFATMFVSTVSSGEIDVGVERLRVGKRMSHLRADARSHGAEEPGHLTTAAFGESRKGFEFSYAAAPDVGPPEDYPGVADPPPGMPAFRSRFFENLRFVYDIPVHVDIRRIRLFHSFETDWEGGRAEAIRWVRYSVPPRLPDGRIDRLSLIGLADTMPSAVAQYMGPGYPFFHAPSVDLSMRYFADTDEEWCLMRVVSHWASDGYASAEATLWDARRTLLAHAAQLMLLRFPDPTELTGS